MNVLDHVQSPVKGLAEIARVLQPKGVLVLSVDSYAGWRLTEKCSRQPAPDQRT